MELLSWTYPCFFALVLVLFWSLPGRVPRQALLMLATLAWYAFGIWWHALAAAVMGTTSWLTGRWIASRPPEQRGLAVAVGVALPVAYFVAFRYLAIWLDYDPWAGDLPWWLPNPLWAPIGLSFIMFESIAIQLDLHWEKLERPGSWWSHMVFTLYFPTRVIGPMRKYQDFTAQVGAVPRPDAAMVAEGLRRIGLGLLRKAVIANPIGTFATFQLQPQLIADGQILPLVLGVYAFWLYLYFDFTGYTDIVVGFSKLLGIRVPENFDRPYLARNVSQYWQRWHMSLSFWVREYVYTPLALTWRAHAWGPPAGALMSMIVLGLWHGLELRFVAFGIWHGLWLGGYMLYADTWKRSALGRRITRTRSWSWAGWFLSFNGIIWSHVFYAVPSYDAAMRLLARVLGLSD